MRHRLVSVKIGSHRLTIVRERARQVSELFGLEALQRTRLVTAVSEIARNTVQYAGEGTLTFLFETQSLHCRGQSLVAQISDKSPGMANLQLVSAEMRRNQLVLQQADLRKNEFLAILAHELRNPLATLNMTLAILRRKAAITPEELVKRSEVMTRPRSRRGATRSSSSRPASTCGCTATPRPCCRWWAT